MYFAHKEHCEVVVTNNGPLPVRANSEASFSVQTATKAIHVHKYCHYWVDIVCPPIPLVSQQPAVEASSYMRTIVGKRTPWAMQQQDYDPQAIIP